MIRLGINGALGRMGRTVGRAILDTQGAAIGAAIESAGSDQAGKDYGTLLGRDPIGVPLSVTLTRKIDALIDFSVPEAAMLRLGECLKTKSGLVVCTTGFDEGQKKRIREAAKKIPILMASNTSIGVAAVGSAAASLARMLGPEFDIEIVEMHHRMKKDAPSGTAITLGESVAGATGRKYPDDFNFGRRGKTGERPAREIGMHALRGGGVVGDHTIIFASDHEIVTLTHRAESRELFARGAVRAAQFVAGANAGFYGIADVLSQPSKA